MLNQQVVRRTLAGETECFSELVRAYRGAIFARMKRMLGNNEEAEEATNDTFARAFEKLSKYDPAKAEFYTWLVRISRNIALDMLRKRKKPPEHKIAEEVGPTASEEVSEEPSAADDQPEVCRPRRGRNRHSVSSDPAEIYRAKCRHKRLLEFVNKLPPRQRDIVLLLYDDYVKPPEVARRLEISERKVRYAIRQIARAADKSKLRTG